MAYNSYVILDEKVAVMDTVDRNFGEEWLNNLRSELGERKPDFLVVQHMEPDHSANIDVFMKEFPEATVVSSAKAFTMMKQFFGTDYADRRIVVGEGDKEVYVEVSDTGKGIAKSNWNRIFEPGFTTKTRGWGLGLSLSRRIIEEYHKGKIAVVRSEPGRGTTIRITLKRHDEDEA